MLKTEIEETAIKVEENSQEAQTEKERLEREFKFLEETSETSGKTWNRQKRNLSNT